MRGYVRGLLEKSPEDRTDSQKVKAAYAFFYGLEEEDQEELWRALSEDEKELILRGSYAEARAEVGVQEAYKRLSDDQQAAVRKLQKAAHRGLGGREENIRGAADLMSGMSGEERDQIRGTLPEEAEEAFEKAEKARKKEKKQSRDRNRDRNRGRGR